MMFSDCYFESNRWAKFKKNFVNYSLYYYSIIPLFQSTAVSEAILEKKNFIFVKN